MNIFLQIILQFPTVEYVLSKLEATCLSLTTWIDFLSTACWIHETCYHPDDKFHSFNNMLNEAFMSFPPWLIYKQGKLQDCGLIYHFTTSLAKGYSLTKWLDQVSLVLNL